MDRKIPIIIDTDPGIDDAVAIMLAAASDRLNIVGLTPVDGNVSAKYTIPNALKISEFLKIDCPVAKGATHQLLTKNTIFASGTHGTDGLGGVKLPEPKGDYDKRPAWDFIYDTAKEFGKELELVAIGPLTNVALAIKNHPDLKDYIKCINIMGGGTEGGNRTAFAEFNFWVDPPAAEIVFKSGIPIVMAGLNVTLKTGISLSFIDDLAKRKSLIAPVVKQLVSKYKDVEKNKDGEVSSVIHDAIPVAYVIDPSMCETKRCKVTINAIMDDERWGESAASFDNPE
ncbi:MAG: nucleoside hydrolase, partial [Oscillospiraceae bacterium]